MQNAKPTKYTTFKGAKSAKYTQNSFKGASKPKDTYKGFNKGGGMGNPMAKRGK